MEEFDVQVIPPTDCSEASLLVRYGSRRMLFNCGEGCQRVCGEKRLKLTNIGEVYLTELNIDTVGGLGGMVLTLADMETARLGGTNVASKLDKNTSNFLGCCEKTPNAPAFSIAVYGPPGVGKVVHAMRHIYKRPNSTIDVFEVDNPSESKGGPGTLTVTPLLLHKNKMVDEESSSKRRKLEAPNYSVPRKFGKLFVHSTRTNASVTGEGDSHGAVCYVLRSPARRGKFQPKKAIELGVPKGPLFRKLANGESVETENGTIVKPEDVMDAAEAQQMMIIMCCPTKDHLTNLLESQDDLFAPYHVLDGIRFMFHLTPQEVVDDERYGMFLKKFTGSANYMEHVYINRRACANEKVFLSSAAVQRVLAEKVDRTLFPLDKSCVENVNGSNLLLCTYVIQPPSIRGIQESGRSQEEADKLGILEKPLEGGDDDDHGFDAFDLTFLGTGAAMPSKYRNVSAILMRTKPHDYGIMFDCGEGTCAQLIRRFGKLRAEEIISKSLKMVWISHMHADHHLGLLKILCKRGAANSEPLIVVGPDSLREFLADNLNTLMEEPNKSFLFVEIRKNMHTGHLLTKSDIPVLEELQVESVLNIPVQHCFNAFGVAVQLTQEKRKIVYSGDTEPCEQLARLGKDAFLLIHEATFENDKASEARGKKHSTVAEAVSMGLQMNAEFTFLTHFSQRYPKETPFEDAKHNGKTKAIFAADLMTVSDKTIQKAYESGMQIASVLQELS